LLDRQMGEDARDRDEHANRVTEGGRPSSTRREKASAARLGRTLDTSAGADAAKRLDAQGFEMLADAAWWMAQPDESFAARDAPYAAFVEAGARDARRGSR